MLEGIDDRAAVVAVAATVPAGGSSAWVPVVAGGISVRLADAVTGALAVSAVGFPLGSAGRFKPQASATVPPTRMSAAIISMARTGSLGAVAGGVGSGDGRGCVSTNGCVNTGVLRLPRGLVVGSSGWGSGVGLG